MKTAISGNLGKA